MKKILITSLISLMLATNVSAGTDGENNLSKKNSGEIKDCFESVNRATFKLNQVLDGVIFEPVAKAYRILPSSVRAGTGNALDNLSTLVTIPNNILQGEFKKAGVNTGRFIVRIKLISEVIKIFFIIFRLYNIYNINVNLELALNMT